MRLRDSFLVMLAAAAVSAAVIVVGALLASNDDWAILVPLAVFSIAGSVGTIIAVAAAVLTEPPHAHGDPVPQTSSGKDAAGRGATPDHKAATAATSASVVDATPQQAGIAGSADALRSPEAPSAAMQVDEAAPEAPTEPKASEVAGTDTDGDESTQPAPIPAPDGTATPPAADASMQSAASETHGHAETSPSVAGAAGGSGTPPPHVPDVTNVTPPLPPPSSPPGGGGLPAWPFLLVLLIITIGVALIARTLVTDQNFRPAANMELIFVVAWGVLGLALVATYLATPPIQRATIAKRLRALAEIGIALSIAGAAMVAYLAVRDRIGTTTLPDFGTLIVGAVVAVGTLIVLRATRSPTQDSRGPSEPGSGVGGAPSQSWPLEHPGNYTSQLLGRTNMTMRDGSASVWTRWLLARWVGGAIAIAGLIPGFLAVTTLSLLFVATALTAKDGLVNGLLETLSQVFGSTGSPDADLRVAVIIVGPVVGIAAWLVAGLGAARVARVDRANTEMYQHLRGRALGIANALDANPQSGNPSEKTKADAWNVARAEFVGIAHALGGDDTPEASALDWITGSGYVSMWRKVHRAEEAELVFGPLTDVLNAALADDARLDGSAVPNKKVLCDRLGKSTKVISDAINPNPIRPPPPTNPPTPGQTMPTSPPPSPEAQLLARLDLLDISQKINEFKDDRSAELVKVRRRLTQSTVWTGVVAYLLLLLTIVSGMPVNLIAAAAGLYLVAALAGLLQRINKEMDIKSGIEDYGVTTARLFLAPLVSGLAGVAGVAVIAILGTPNGLLPAGTATTASLQDAFNLTKYPVALVLAAAFGLAPGNLFARLQTVSDKLKTDISSTDPNSNTNTGGSSG